MPVLYEPDIIPIHFSTIREFTQKPLYMGAEAGAGSAPGTILYHSSKKANCGTKLYQSTDVMTSSVHMLEGRTKFVSSYSCNSFA